MVLDPKCNICLFNDWLGYTNPTRACQYCLSTRERENFVSIYQEEPKQIIESKKRNRRKSPKKVEEKTHPKRRIDDPERMYKVLYRDPNTGDWFYELNTQDMIGHYKDKKVDDILDVV